MSYTPRRVDPQAELGGSRPGQQGSVRAARERLRMMQEQQDGPSHSATDLQSAEAAAYRQQEQEQYQQAQSQQYQQSRQYPQQRQNQQSRSNQGNRQQAYANHQRQQQQYQQQRQQQYELEEQQEYERQQQEYEVQQQRQEQRRRQQYEQQQRRQYEQQLAQQQQWQQYEQEQQQLQAQQQAQRRQYQQIQGLPQQEPPYQPQRAEQRRDQPEARTKSPLEELTSARYQQPGSAQAWPLDGGDGSSGSPQSANTSQPRSKIPTSKIPTSKQALAKGTTPPRPPRPDADRNLMDLPQLQNATQQAQYQNQPNFPPHSGRRQYGQVIPDVEPDPNDPNHDGSRPVTLSSHTSSHSSLGPIPDFPVPETPPGTDQRRQPGPVYPPPARRGPSAYPAYPQMSFISPIKEESEDRRSSKKSYASSNALPQRDMSGSYYISDGETPSDEEGPRTNTGVIKRDQRHMRDTNASPEAGVVRNASLGKRSKPTLTTINSVETIRDTRNPAVPTGMTAVPIAITSRGAIDQIVNPSKSKPKDNNRDFAQGTTFVDDSTTEASDSPIKAQAPPMPKPALRMPAAALLKPSSRGNDLARPIGTAKSTDGLLVEQTQSGRESRNRLSRLSSRQSINVGLANAGGVGASNLQLNPAREIDSRASMSLPDLIRRATKLAANLDRGRTASTLGFDWMIKQDGTRERLPEDGSDRGRGSRSMSDMLAAFPPPGWVTPDGERHLDSRDPASTLRKASPMGDFDTALPYGAGYGRDLGDRRKRGRRCCGMRLWVFLIVLTILLLLVAAAVTVPITLIILPRQQEEARQRAGAAMLAQCEQTSACLNGGSSIVNADASCGCLCSNGFTGENCATADLLGCTGTSVFNIQAMNATVGSAIPRIVETGMVRFGVPLDIARLLILFARNNLSCAGENALVTFNGAVAKRRVSYPHSQHEKRALRPQHTQLQPSRTIQLASARPTSLRKRQLPATRGPGIAVTSAGIIFATPSAYTNSLAPTTTGPSVARGTGTFLPIPNPNNTPSPSQTLPFPAAPPSSTASLSPFQLSKAEEFSRVSVLFVLQESGNLQTATSAQGTLQSFLREVGQGQQGVDGSVNLRDGFSVDFGGFRIRVGNGTFVGGVQS